MWYHFKFGVLHVCIKTQYFEPYKQIHVSLHGNQIVCLTKNVSSSSVTRAHNQGVSRTTQQCSFSSLKPVPASWPKARRNLVSHYKLIIELGADIGVFSFFFSISGEGVERRDVQDSLQRGPGGGKTHQKEEVSCWKLLIIHIRQHVGIHAVLISGSVGLAQRPRHVALPQPCPASHPNLPDVCQPARPVSD